MEKKIIFACALLAFSCSKIKAADYIDITSTKQISLGGYNDDYDPIIIERTLVQTPSMPTHTIVNYKLRGSSDTDDARLGTRVAIYLPSLGQWHIYLDYLPIGTCVYQRDTLSDIT